MNLTKIALLSAFALIFAGCGPKNLPSQWSATPAQTAPAEDDGSAQNFEDVAGQDESLTADDTLSDADARPADSPTGEKVSGWLNSNSIPENAKLAVVYFGYDQFTIEEGERGKLDAVVEAVKRGNIFIVGYADYFGTEEYNLALSDKRAQAVKNYLISLGTDDSAQIRALGEAYAVQNGTREEVAEDRKVIVVDGNAQ